MSGSCPPSIFFPPELSTSTWPTRQCTCPAPTNITDHLHCSHLDDLPGNFLADRQVRTFRDVWENYPPWEGRGRSAVIKLSLSYTLQLTNLESRDVSFLEIWTKNFTWQNFHIGLEHLGLKVHNIKLGARPVGLGGTSNPPQPLP